MCYTCGIQSTLKGEEMPQTSPFPITLADHERATIEAMARKYTASYREVTRAKIILYAAAGLQNKDIAARLDTSPQIVSKWRKRFFEERLDGLDDAPRHGRPARFSPHNRRHHQSDGM